MEWLQNSLSFADSPGLLAQTNQALRWIETWREPLVATVLFLECMPIAGLLVPGQIVLTIAGFWGASQLPTLAIRMFLTCLVAIFVADTVMFALGRYCSHRFAFLNRWLGEHAAFAKALSEQPFGLLLFYQFPPYTRMFGPLLMGATQRRWRSWLWLCSLASLGFVVAFFGLGYSIGIAGKAALTSASFAGLISAVCALLFLVWLPVFIRRIMKTALTPKSHG